MPDNSQSYLLPNPYFVWRMLLSMSEIGFPPSSQVWVPAFRERQPAESCMENQTLPHRRNLRTGGKNSPPDLLLKRGFWCPGFISPFLRQKICPTGISGIPIECVAGSLIQVQKPPASSSWMKGDLKFDRKRRVSTTPPKGSVSIQVWFCMYLGRKQKRRK